MRKKHTKEKIQQGNSRITTYILLNIFSILQSVLLCYYNIKYYSVFIGNVWIIIVQTFFFFPTVLLNIEN